MRHTAFLTCLALLAATARAADPPPAAPPAARPSAIDPKADALLKRMGQTLAGAKAFSFESHSMVDHVLDTGQKVQTARNQAVVVRRPDAVAARVVGDGIDLRFVYDGKRVVVLNGQSNTWGATDAPPAGGIDATFDALAEKFGLAVPLADLIRADPHKDLTAQARAAQDLGDGWVFDVKCRHLAYRQPGVDWQVWLEDLGDRVLPRKVVITYKELPGHPQFTAFLSKWDLAPTVSPDAFKFEPPAGAKQVDFGPVAPAVIPTDAPKK